MCTTTRTRCRFIGYHPTKRLDRADLRQELNDNRKTLVEALADQRQAAAGLNRVAAYNKGRLAGRPASLPDSLTLKNASSTMSTAAWESTVATQAYGV